MKWDFKEYLDKGRELYSDVSKDPFIIDYSDAVWVYPETSKHDEIVKRECIITDTIDLPGRVFESLYHLECLCKSLKNDKRVPSYMSGILESVLEGNMATHQNLIKYIEGKKKSLWAGKVVQYGCGLKAAEKNDLGVARRAFGHKINNWGQKIRIIKESIMESLPEIGKTRDGSGKEIEDDIKKFLEWIDENFEIDYDRGSIGPGFNEGSYLGEELLKLENEISKR